MSAHRVMRSPFVKARRFWVEEALPALAIGTAREPVWFSRFGDGPIDAPQLIPAGGMRAAYLGQIGVMYCERGGK